MCFGRAIWLGRSLSRNRLQCYCSAIAYHCGFAAYRKPPLVNILASDYPIHQTVLLQKRRNSCDTRAHCLRCVVCCHGAAVLVRSFRFGVPAIVEIVRARVAQAGAATRAGCAHSSGSVWAMNVHGYRSSGAALCCGLIHQHRYGHPLPIVVTYALVVAEPCAWVGARRHARCNSFAIHSAR